eukprot:Skav213982  [mRNA]  locus=scaffold3014:41580:44521:- [translate_table: standard]
MVFLAAPLLALQATAVSIALGDAVPPLLEGLRGKPHVAIPSDGLLRRELHRHDAMPVSLTDDIEDPEEVEVEAEAEEAASSLSSGLLNASAKVQADENAENTEMIHEDPPLEPVNVTLLEGPAGKPAVIFSGLTGPSGFPGERGPTGLQGVQGPPGSAGASVVGPRGKQGTPGQRGKMGKTGKVGAKGHAGSRGKPGAGAGELLVEVAVSQAIGVPPATIPW